MKFNKTSNFGHKITLTKHQIKCMIPAEPSKKPVSNSWIQRILHLCPHSRTQKSYKVVLKEIQGIRYPTLDVEEQNYCNWDFTLGCLLLYERHQKNINMHYLLCCWSHIFHAFTRRSGYLPFANRLLCIFM